MIFPLVLAEEIHIMTKRAHTVILYFSNEVNLKRGTRNRVGGGSIGSGWGAPDALMSISIGGVSIGGIGSYGVVQERGTSCRIGGSGLRLC